MSRPVLWFLIGASVPLIAVAVVLFWNSPVERCVRDQERTLGADSALAHKLCAVLRH
ncbi:MAG TPA: hypothetical protein VGI95_03035 [Caulobacteraceae bacterium]|jgi:hypothetical protein